MCELQTKCVILGRSWKIMFFSLIIHHNNRNKSINFIFMWNQADKKFKKNINAAKNSDAGGDDKLNFFFMWPNPVKVEMYSHSN